MLFPGIMIGIGMCDGKSAMGIYGLQTEGDFGCMLQGLLSTREGNRASTQSKNGSREDDYQKALILHSVLLTPFEPGENEMITMMNHRNARICFILFIFARGIYIFT